MKQITLGLGGLTLVATLATVVLWLFGQQVAAAIVGSTTLFLWLALLVVGTVAVSSWWSASLMQKGAELALRSQESDDRRDTILIKSIADLIRSLLRHSQPELPALPMPSQQADWLPELAEFETREEKANYEPQHIFPGGHPTRNLGG